MQAQELDIQSQAVFVGRQPIFNMKQKIYAYELLFRSSEVNSADHLDGKIATANVLHNALLEIGLDELVGDSYAFINFPRELVINGITDILPPERVVIEILEDVVIDDELITGIQSLSEQGFRIALDDFVYGDEWLPLLELTDIIKLDVMNKTTEDINKTVQLLKPYDVTLLAEKVETRNEFEVYQQMGIEYFQGYFFAKPNVVKKDKIPENHIALLQLISRLQDPDIEIKEVEELLTHTVSLSFKLFRYVNSASYGLSRKFDSIPQATIYFGLKKLKDLASMIALTDINNNSSSELIHIGLARAKMCEILALKLGSQDKDTYFLIGLFSILEALLSLPLDDIIARLALSEDVINALLTHIGDKGEALECSLACEECRYSDIKFKDLELNVITQAYVEAMGWARKATENLNA